ncbi:hypothetical protein ABZU45_13555 [Streptomyces avermitilis]|uniref:hypothetical protein n=1 Tax=Streptomyces avermitilis TaxID=33903 RepID=UPI0033B803F7
MEQTVRSGNGAAGGILGPSSAGLRNDRHDGARTPGAAPQRSSTVDPVHLVDPVKGVAS